MPRSHKHGQHFLRSPQVAAELIGHSNITKSDLVYDLGAGSGVITGALSRRARQVIAVEIEPQALASLDKNVGDLTNVEIVAQDMLKLKLPPEDYKVLANIPFSLSAKVVRQLAFADSPPQSIYLIVQKQFARKLVPGDDHFTSQLAAQIGPWWQVRIRKNMQKRDYTPPPAVETVLLEIKKRPTAWLDIGQQVSYCKFIEKAFAEQKYYATLPRESVKISAELRPSQLTLEQWLRLWQKYQ